MVLSTETESKIILIGGMTGSGKTDILHSLAAGGEQILDLEKIARHKGSVFGGMGQKKQPTNEQFENDVAEKWLAFDHSARIWIEDEVSIARQNHCQHAHPHGVIPEADSVRERCTGPPPAAARSGKGCTASRGTNPGPRGRSLL